MNSAGRFASLSLDLDNQWSYMKTHGNPEWKTLPTYLRLVIPRFLEILERHQFRITVFVVGQDAAMPEHQRDLRTIVQAGHEIGNHSFHHEPWTHLKSPKEVESEIIAAERAIQSATGVHPIGYRGPGYSLSQAVLQTLINRGYLYDASTLPTFIGPLARAYYFMSTKLEAHQKEERALLFGTFRDGFRPLQPYLWVVDGRHLIEVPVTTLPLLRVPIHLSYVLYLAMHSERSASLYFRCALHTCRLAGIAPSLLLHPLDFIGCGEAPPLDFFPAMKMPLSSKLRILNNAFQMLSNMFEVVSMEEHARRFRKNATRPAPELRWQSH